MSRQKLTDADIGRFFESALAAAALTSFVVDPYAVWKIRWHTVSLEYAFCCELLALGGPFAARVEQLHTVFAVCEHYRRENNFQVMRRRLLPEHCADRAPGGRWCDCSLESGRPFITYPDEPCTCDARKLERCEA